jgi:hypothetical protein
VEADVDERQEVRHAQQGLQIDPEHEGEGARQTQDGQRGEAVVLDALDQLGALGGLGVTVQEAD